MNLPLGAIPGISLLCIALAYRGLIVDHRDQVIYEKAEEAAIRQS
jgi:hypothetical protein